MDWSCGASERLVPEKLENNEAYNSEDEINSSKNMDQQTDWKDLEDAFAKLGETEFVGIVVS